MNERDERWQAQQDALALEDDAEPSLDFEGLEGGDPRWNDELDFYASLSEHASRDAEPSPGDAALVEAALAAVPTAARTTSVVRFGLVAAVVAMAAVALLWMAWPQEARLRAEQRSWTTEAQDVLGAMAREHAQAEARATKPVRDEEPEPQVELEPPEPEPEPEPDDATARAARGDGRLADAERSYGELLRRFPKSAEARAGRVALAQIKLGRGKAKAALRLFSAAATGGGPLAEEAAWGQIQALDRLGREDALRKAVDAFTRDYPSSVYRARAQGRLDP